MRTAIHPVWEWCQVEYLGRICSTTLSLVSFPGHMQSIFHMGSVNTTNTSEKKCNYCDHITILVITEVFTCKNLTITTFQYGRQLVLLENTYAIMVGHM